MKKTIVRRLGIVLIGVLFVGSSMPSATAAPRIQFNVPEALLEDFPVHEVISEDFNEDGFEDLVLFQELSPSHLFLSDGRGGSNRSDLETPGQTKDAVSADFDEDGHLDLAFTRDRFLRVLFGDGAGGFPRQIDLEMDPDPIRFLAVADLDQDSHLDLIAGSDDGNPNLSDDIVVRLGDGAGAFGQPNSFLAGDGINGLSVGRFDGDGFLDVVTISQEGDFVILLGDGTGSFHAPYTIFDGNQEALYSGDFNGDEAMDFLSLRTPGHVELRLADGVGGLLRVAITNPGEFVSDLVIRDWNDDGHLDFLFAQECYGILRTKLGDGTGQFSDGISLIANAGAGRVNRRLFDSDPDGDGTRDLILASQKIIVIPGKPVGEFETPTVLDDRRFLTDAQCLDLTQDGHLDLLTSYSGGGRLFAGDGDGEFVDVASPVDSDFRDPLSFADFDGDGDPDVALIEEVSIGSKVIRIQLHVGGGVYSDPIETTINLMEG